MTSPLSTPACRAAPMATISSGFTPLLGSLPPVRSLTSSVTSACGWSHRRPRGRRAYGRLLREVHPSPGLLQQVSGAALGGWASTPAAWPGEPYQGGLSAVVNRVAGGLTRPFGTAFETCGTFRSPGHQAGASLRTGRRRASRQVPAGECFSAGRAYLAAGVAVGVHSELPAGRCAAWWVVLWLPQTERQRPASHGVVTAAPPCKNPATNVVGPVRNYESRPAQDRPERSERGEVDHAGCRSPASSFVTAAGDGFAMSLAATGDRDAARSGCRGGGHGVAACAGVRVVKTDVRWLRKSVVMSGAARNPR